MNHNWVGRQINQRDDSGLPLFAVGAGPAQRWRFRFVSSADHGGAQASAVALTPFAAAPAAGPAAATPPAAAATTADNASKGPSAQALKEAFERFDADRSGKLDVSELSQALVHLGLSGASAAEYAARYDTAATGGLGSGLLSLEDFTALYHDAAAGQGLSSATVAMRPSPVRRAATLRIRAAPQPQLRWRASAPMHRLNWPLGRRTSFSSRLWMPTAGWTSRCSRASSLSSCPRRGRRRRTTTRRGVVGDGAGEFTASGESGVADAGPRTWAAASGIWCRTDGYPLSSDGSGTAGVTGWRLVQSSALCHGAASAAQPAIHERAAGANHTLSVREAASAVAGGSIAVRVAVVDEFGNRVTAIDDGAVVLDAQLASAANGKVEKARGRSTYWSALRPHWPGQHHHPWWRRRGAHLVAASTRLRDCRYRRLRLCGGRDDAHDC